MRRPHQDPTSTVPDGADVNEALLEAKLDPPRHRPGTVARRSLVDRLVSGASYPLVVISAPVGFGKATLLADWAAADARRFAWVSLDRGDDEPVALFRSITRAIDRLRPVDPKLFVDLAAPGISVLGRLVPRVLGALQALDEATVLVLRDLHTVHRKEARDALDLLLDHLPPNIQIAVTSRQSVWLANPRRRGRGDVLELGPEDLAFDADEAAQLLASVGVDVGPNDVDELVRSSDGWPAGLYLCALALRAQAPGPDRNPVPSAHPFVSQYLRSEVLSHLPAPTLRFLRRTAILEVMSGELCDALLDTTGSARQLESIAQTNFFVQSIDDRREWFRYHTLFRATLLDDLAQREPDIIASLHVRAAEWWAAQGSVDQAILHAKAGARPERAGELVAAHITGAYIAGRVTDTERWLRDLGDTVIEGDPGLAVLAGWIAALTGRPVEASRWSALVENHPGGEFAGEDATWFEALRSMLQAALCAHGVAAMKADAERAVSLMPAWKVWHNVGAGMLALALLLQGDDDQAELVFTDAVQSSQASGARVPHARWLAHRALLRMDRGDWLAAARDVDDALAIVDANGLQEYGASAIVYAATARLCIHRSDRAGAAAAQLHAMRLRTPTTWSLPHLGVLLRLELADTQLALADVDGARILLREIDEILHHRPQLGVLNDRVDALRTRLSTAQHVLNGGPTLTAAELRIVPYLPTNLTLQEIGDRLYISRNTVNTHVRSIYRKLRVSGRGETVRRAREMGLLADTAPGRPER
jgi:LuxR family maltose regulon positive regulatory protein